MAERRVDPTTMQVVKKAWASILSKRQEDPQTNVIHFTDHESDTGFLKDVDALNALLEPYLLAPTSFVDPPLPLSDLEDHLKTCVQIISANATPENSNYRGFAATPYPYFQSMIDFVDSAAAFLRLVCNYCQVLRIPGNDRRDKDKETKIETLLKNPFTSAIDFLISAHVGDDDGLGVRWEGIARQSDQRGRFASLFFTNVAAVALAKTLDTSPVSRWIGQDRREQIEGLLQKVPKWVINQYNPAAKNFYIDAARAVAPAVGVVYALEILFALGDASDEAQKKCCMESLREITLKMKNLSQASALQIDVFHSIPLSGASGVAFYDDRRYIGSFLSVLALAKSKYPDVQDEDFFHAIDILLEGVREEWIDEPTGLWDDGRPLICYTQDALVGLVTHAVYGQVDMISMRENEMRIAIQEALRSEDITTVMLSFIKSKSQSPKSLFGDKVRAKEAGR
ncbi:MAG TPA: hypothetical protein VG649_11665 [Candidatus Angelobacter sp.]|nr:hypothetical protein [Candidatus Angelobacter sp.]